MVKSSMRAIKANLLSCSSCSSNCRMLRGSFDDNLGTQRCFYYREGGGAPLFDGSCFSSHLLPLDGDVDIFVEEVFDGNFVKACFGMTKTSTLSGTINLNLRS